MKSHPKIFELPHLHNREGIFRDRAAAGKVLAQMLKEYQRSNATVMAIPAGGVAVAASLARELALPLDVAVISKITPSWNSEVGYGAVAFDGMVRLNEDYLARFNLGKEEIQKGIQKTKQKVARRVKMFRGNRPLPDFNQRILLVDDGLASGFTLRVAIEALRKAGGQQIILAVPTAHEESIQRVINEVDAIYCPNIRGGLSYAVADAYEEWRDLDEEEVMQILKEFELQKRT